MRPFAFVSAEFVTKLLSRYDIERVLFGSDYPMWSSGDEIASLFDLKLPHGHYKKILYENCARVYELDSAFT